MNLLFKLLCNLKNAHNEHFFILFNYLLNLYFFKL